MATHVIVDNWYCKMNLSSSTYFLLILRNQLSTKIEMDSSINIISKTKQTVKMTVIIRSIK